MSATATIVHINGSPVVLFPPEIRTDAQRLRAIQNPFTGEITLTPVRYKSDAARRKRKVKALLKMIADDRAE